MPTTRQPTIGKARQSRARQQANEESEITDNSERSEPITDNSERSEHDNRIIYKHKI